MVNNSTNINKTNNHLSPQIIDHKKSLWNMMLESRYWLGQVQKFTSLLYTGILSYYFMSQGYTYVFQYVCLDGWWVWWWPNETKMDTTVSLHGQINIIVINATFNNISVISWQSVLLVEYTDKTTDLLQSLTNSIT
jgi:hypothetical protein